MFLHLILNSIPIMDLYKMEDFSQGKSAGCWLGKSVFYRRKIIETYDGNGDGICETIEVAKWLVDCYRAMNKSFQPTATDIASYVQVIDKNKNGKVSVEELESFIIRYFLNSSRN